MTNVKRNYTKAGNTLISFTDKQGKKIELVLQNYSLKLKIDGKYKNTIANNVSLSEAQVVSEAAAKAYAKAYTDDNAVFKTSITSTVTDSATEIPSGPAVKQYVSENSGAPSAGAALAARNKFTLMGEQVGCQPGLIRSGKIPNKVVVIGNSMTLHGYLAGTWEVNDYREMAASTPTSGWVSLVQQHLVALNPDVKVYKAAGALWEQQDNASKEYATIQNSAVYEVTSTGSVATAYTLDQILDSNVDVIICQLYENITDTTGSSANCVALSTAYGRLYTSLRAKSVNARLYQFCGFWQTEGKNTAVMSACGKHFVEPIHAPELIWEQTGMSSLFASFKAVAGENIYDGNNNVITTVSAIAAGHPSDFGFACMASHTIFSLYNSGLVTNMFVKRLVLRMSNSFTIPQLITMWLDSSSDATGSIYYDTTVTSMSTFTSTLGTYIKYLLLPGMYSMTIKIPTDLSGTTFAATQSLLTITTNGTCAYNYLPVIQRIEGINSNSNSITTRKTVISADTIAYGSWYIK